MGSSVSRLSRTIFGKKEIRILMMGLDAVGKTTILYKLKVDEIGPVIPTIGFAVETVEYKDFIFTAWDVGGQDKIRPLWKHFFEATHGLIFVIDSSDKERTQIAKEELHRLLDEEDLKGKPILVFANKQDLAVMSVAEVGEKLGLPDVTERIWHIEGTSAITGEGLHEGLEWLRKMVSTKK